MSLKLPLIVKKDPTLASPPKPANPLSPPPQAPDTPSKQPGPPFNQEEEYEDHEFQQLEEEAEQENPQPIDTITVLMPREKQSSMVDSGSLEIQQGIRPKSSLKELEVLLEQKLHTVGQLRNSIADKKRQIKDIGDQIDKDLNKSLLKASKQKSVNLRDIFSATPPKTHNLKLDSLNDQLKSIRLCLRKVKQAIQKIHEAQSDPVSLMNEERGLEFKTRIRSAEQSIKTIQHEKQLLQSQIERGSRQIDQEESKQKDEDMLRLTQQLNEIQSSQREQKVKLYRIQKEDISLVEKNKYFQERVGQLGIRKPKPSERPKDQLEGEIKHLITDINATIEQRNRTECDKKTQFKQLSLELSSLETKNWDLCNKLREIDTFLLQYYQKKTRKKEVKPMQKTVDLMQNPLTGKAESQNFASEGLQKSKLSINDKNFQSVEVQVQKKKNYEFGVREPIEGEVNLSDQFLGPKIRLRALTIDCSDDRIHRISAQYKHQNGATISGLKMGVRVLPEGVATMELRLYQEQVINFIHIAYSEESTIVFLHLVTSLGTELKWGTLEGVVKSEQKHIKKYETCFLRAKLAVRQQQISDFGTCLAGLTLVTTYIHFVNK